MLKNIGSNWFLMALSGLSTLFLMPFNLAHLGATQYGLWLVVAALTAYLYLLHLGVPMASVREMTQAIAARDIEKLNRVISSCALLYIALGVVVGFVGIPLLIYFEHAYAIPTSLRTTARLAFILALLQTGLGFFAYQPYAILTAYQSFVPKNVLMALVIAIKIVVNVGLAMVSDGFWILAATNLIAMVIETIVTWGYVLRAFPDVRPRLALFDRTMLGGIAGYGVYVFLLALGGQLAFQTTPLVIGQLLTSADVVTFGVPNSLMLILMQFLGGISAVINPVATALQAQGAKCELRTIVVRWDKISLALTWCAAAFLIVFGPSFLAFWVKSAYTPETGRVLRILTVSYLVFLPIRGVAVPVMLGLGLARGPTIATLAAGALNLVLSVVWVRDYGIDGAAWAAFVPNVVMTIVLTIQLCRALSMRTIDFLAATLPRATIGGIVALAVMAIWSEICDPVGLVALGISGMLTVIVCGLIWSRSVLRDDPHVRLPSLGDMLATWQARVRA